MDCTSQIAKLTTWVNHIFSTLDQTSPKHTNKGIILSLFSSAEINPIKNNIAILEEKQDILSDQLQKTFKFVNPTYAETNTNWLLLKS